MNLAYLFLAENAVLQGGRFYAYGGGVHYLAAEGFQDESIQASHSLRVFDLTQRSRRYHMSRLGVMARMAASSSSGPVKQSQGAKRELEYPDLAYLQHICVQL